MKVLSRWVDPVGYWIAKAFTPVQQMRIGVVMMNISLGFLAYFPFAKEDAGIYLMSFLALLVGGWGIVVTARLAFETADDHDIEEMKKG